MISAKDYLDLELKHIDDELNTQEELLKIVKARCEKSTTTLSDMPHSTGDNHGREGLYVKMIMLDNEIAEKIIARSKDIARKKEKIMGMMEKIGRRSRLILTQYYLLGRTLEEIGRDIGYSKSHTQVLLQEAYAEFQEVMERGE